MDYIRRVYVAGVGYTCYLTETRFADKMETASSSSVAVVGAKVSPASVRHEGTTGVSLISIAPPRQGSSPGSAEGGVSGKPGSAPRSGIGSGKPAVAPSATQERGDSLKLESPRHRQSSCEAGNSAGIGTSVGATYLNLKIGYTDIKSIDITKYIVDKQDPLEILIVGKEILATPGYQEILIESEPVTGAVVSPIKAIIIIRGNNKDKVNSLAASIRNLRPYSVYKGIGLRLQGEPLNLKVVVKNKQKG